MLAPSCLAYHPPFDPMQGRVARRSWAWSWGWGWWRASRPAGQTHRQTPRVSHHHDRQHHHHERPEDFKTICCWWPPSPPPPLLVPMGAGWRRWRACWGAWAGPSTPSRSTTCSRRPAPKSRSAATATSHSPPSITDPPVPAVTVAPTDSLLIHRGSGHGRRLVCWSCSVGPRLAAWRWTWCP